MAESFQRDLLRGSLDLVVLSALVDGSMYGYLIQNRIREVSLGRVELKAGTLYPLLHRLEADKLIRSKWDDSTGRRRKWYELTVAGSKRLKVQSQEWHSYVECIGALLKPLPPSAPKPA